MTKGTKEGESHDNQTDSNKDTWIPPTFVSATHIHILIDTHNAPAARAVPCSGMEEGVSLGNQTDSTITRGHKIWVSYTY
jgi:hypothetical protein